MTAYRPVVAEINLAALKFNLQQVRAYAPNSKVLAVIKANGYGHGIHRVANQLSSCDAFGVASMDEAIELRQYGFLHRIVLLEGLFSSSELQLALNHRFDLVVHNFEQLEWLATLESSASLKIWIKFDTGMHRLGFTPSDAPEILNCLSKLKASVQLHIMSHFASADIDEAFTQKQLAEFLTLSPHFQCAKSIASSAAIQRFPETHLDWVRPGIMLYGGRASKESHPQVRPVMTLKSKVISLKWIQAGEAIGYGQTWRTKEEALIAVVAVGYGDGYPRHAPSGTPILICGQKAPLVGRVSMDMITVDVTSLSDQIRLGDMAILWGEGLSVDEVADCAGTIGYELLCQITPRVPKVEVEG